MNKAAAAALLENLAERFGANPQRHLDADWAAIAARLAAGPAKLAALHAMEESGGEPDVIGGADQDGAWHFYDCATETPLGRRSLCYDQAAFSARKANKPAGSAQAMAAEIGASLLTEAEYRHLQQFGDFDLKTSSWVVAPPDIRAVDGGLFCDKRYGRVFVYHNGPQSYYASRGFRCLLKV
jgi:hypothetical protein